MTLSVTDLSCTVADRTLFSGLSVTVRNGESLAILGASGAGKSTLLLAMAGLAKPAAGTVTFDGRPVAGGKPPEFAVVLQGHGLLSLLTARESVEAALRANGVPARTAFAQAPLAIASVDLRDFSDQLVSALSGGQRQRVAIACALAQSPQVLFLDEPTSEQDTRTTPLVERLVFEVADNGGIVVVATHDTRVAALCTASIRLPLDTPRPAAN